MNKRIAELIYKLQSKFSWEWSNVVSHFLILFLFLQYEFLFSQIVLAKDNPPIIVLMEVDFWKRKKWIFRINTVEPFVIIDDFWASMAQYFQFSFREYIYYFLQLHVNCISSKHVRRYWNNKILVKYQNFDRNRPRIVGILINWYGLFNNLGLLLAVLTILEYTCFYISNVYF